MCECEEGKCSCSSNCKEQSCECGNGCGCGEEQCSKLDMYFWLAKQAKMELLKEKMKKRLEASDGKRLDRVTELIVGALLEHNKAEADVSKRRQELNEQLEKIFSED
mgnify:CR=1 FL=1